MRVTTRATRAFVHHNYDGPEDDRHGRAASVQEAKDRIAEIDRPHHDASKLRVPKRLSDEVLVALDNALGRLQMLTQPHPPKPSAVEQQICQFGWRVLDEASSLLQERRDP